MADSKALLPIALLGYGLAALCALGWWQSETGEAGSSESRGTQSQGPPPAAGGPAEGSPVTVRPAPSADPGQAEGPELAGGESRHPSDPQPFPATTRESPRAAGRSEAPDPRAPRSSHANPELELARSRSRAKLLEQRIRDLVKRAPRKLEHQEPDGKVTSLAKDRAWIDRGSAHGLRRGMRFQTYRWEGRGPKTGERITALIEVLEVEAQRGLCGVLREVEVRDPQTGATRSLPDAGWPLAVGDGIWNPFFDPAARATFLLIGQPRQKGLADLIGGIQAWGGKVAPNPGIAIDYVVVLDESTQGDEELYREAMFLGAARMTERELLRFIGG
jgi:hypothetical protein